MHARCPNCQIAIEVVPDTPIEQLTCPSCGSRFNYDLNQTVTFRAGVARTVGHFALLESVGVGHFGEVWKARDTQLDRIVALKIPRTQDLTRGSVERFLHEAQAAAQLRHPHIVPVHEVGRDGDTLYIVSDFIQGVTLAAQLNARRYSPREAAALCATVAEALHHAHGVGVVHRDLKPGNIMLDGENRPHLTDFGLAKREAAEATVTAAGKVLGTPAYMSPEQARGEGHGADRRSDVYSLGVVLYELLTGVRPFMGSDMRLLLHQVMFDEPVPPRRRDRRVPRDLETICLKALAKLPERRYATAQEMAADLHRFLRGEPITAKRVSRVERVWRWGRRYPARAGSVMLSVVVVALAVVIVLGRDTGPAKRVVALNTTPSGATVTFIPLDMKTGEPLPLRATLADGPGPVTARLAPGEYLVVAVLQDYGFHEVYRYVPTVGEPTINGSTVYRHNRWKVLSDGIVELPAIDPILPASIKDSMVAFPGAAQFTMGVAGDMEILPHDRSVPPFHLDTHEVTFAEYRDEYLKDKRALASKIAKLLDPLTPDTYPMTFVSYDDALDHAERVGKRLPDEFEFEFAATNGGTVADPWAGQGEPADAWEIGPFEKSRFPLQVGNRTVYGLFSNVVEWTSSWAANYPGLRHHPAQKLGGEERIVRGGPASALGFSDAPKGYRGPRMRIMQLRQAFGPGLGFRCARSDKPRLTPADFGRIIPDGESTAP